MFKQFPIKKNIYFLDNYNMARKIAVISVLSVVLLILIVAAVVIRYRNEKRAREQDRNDYFMVSLPQEIVYLNYKSK